MRVILSLVVMVVAGLVIGLSCDKATEPVEPEPKDYAVYIADLDLPSIHEYHPNTGIVHSHVLPFVLSRSYMTIAPDGRTLYVPGNDSMYVLDLATGEMTGFWPEVAPIALSSDGRLMAIQGRHLQIFELPGMTLLFDDTSQVGSGGFSVDGSRFYGLSSPSPGLPGEIYQVSLDGSFGISRTHVADHHPQQLAYSDRYDRWFLYTRIGECESEFSVYDSATNTIVYSYNLYPGSGWMAVSPDGEYVLYTNPGFVISLCSEESQGEIFVYDISGNRLHKLLQVIWPLSEAGPTTPVPVSRLTFTPDGRWLVGTYMAPYFVLIDARRFETDSLLGISGSSLLSVPTCQTQP